MAKKESDSTDEIKANKKKASLKEKQTIAKKLVPSATKKKVAAQEKKTPPKKTSEPTTTKKKTPKITKATKTEKRASRKVTKKSGQEIVADIRTSNAVPGTPVAPKAALPSPAPIPAVKKPSAQVKTETVANPLSTTVSRTAASNLKTADQKAATATAGTTHSVSTPQTVAITPLNSPGERKTAEPSTIETPRKPAPSATSRKRLPAAKSGKTLSDTPDISILKKTSDAAKKSTFSLPLSTSVSAGQAPEEQRHVGPEPTPTGLIDRGQPIPEGYGFDRLVALPRDPQWAFCYWELTAGLLNKVRTDRGSDLVDACAWVIRIHRINEDIAVDVEIDPSIGNWYIHVVKPGRYQFELGLLTPDGDFISLLVSQPIETPEESPSHEIDEEWRLRPEDEERLNRMLLETLGLEADGRSRGTSGFLGASVLPSSWRLPFSFAGASWGGSLSGRPIAGSWAWSFQGASGQPSSPGGLGSDNLGWLVGADGRHEPVLLRPLRTGGPNWNEQKNLPTNGPSKSQAPNFKVKLPRVLHNLPLPKPSWPPSSTRGAVKGAMTRKAKSLAPK